MSQRSLLDKTGGASHFWVIFSYFYFYLILFLLQSRDGGGYRNVLGASMSVWPRRSVEQRHDVKARDMGDCVSTWWMCFLMVRPDGSKRRWAVRQATQRRPWLLVALGRPRGHLIIVRPCRGARLRSDSRCNSVCAGAIAGRRGWDGLGSGALAGS